MNEAPLFARAFTALALTALTGCAPGDLASGPPACDPDDGGLTLPDGFCALVVAEDVGRARHLAVTENGDIFIALGASRRGGGPVGVVALRDTTGDGKADVTVNFGDDGGTGLAIRDGSLYFGPDWGVLRYPLPTGALEPAGPPDTIVRGLPDSLNHRSKALAIAPDGALYVNIGSPGNACQTQSRTQGSPGMDPCPQLETRAGIWRFDANTTGQSQAQGVRFATGLRNTVALAINPMDSLLYGVIHGRDQLGQLWPDIYTEQQNAELPAEEFVRISEGADFGWPYCYYDPELDRYVLAPEYGGDGQSAGRCEGLAQPLIAFPAHWGPNGLLFYTGGQFPERYRGGAFIAFHGSWNRAPLPQGGYNVVFAPFEGGEPTGEWEVFADGFAGDQVDPRNADHRPVGLAQGPDGSLYVADDQGGTIFRIIHQGM